MTIKRRPYIRTDGDGVVTVHAWTERRDAPGTDFSTADGLETVDSSSPYYSVSLRDMDIESAVAGGYEAERKIRVKRTKAIEAAMSGEHSVWVGECGRMYRVTYADTDKTHAYLTLAEVRSVGICTLIEQEAVKDADLVEHMRDKPTYVHVRKAGPASESEGTEGSKTGLVETVSVTVRDVDYSSQPVVSWGGKRWNVTAAESDGEWTTLKLARKARSIR